MSPLLDEIYACLTVLSAHFLHHSSEARHPYEAADRIPVRPDRTGLALLVACMKGCAGAIDFILNRERHLVSGMSCNQLLALLHGWYLSERYRYVE